MAFADHLNTILAAVMVIFCLAVIAKLLASERAKSDLAFVLFWGVWWLMILIIYPIFRATDFEKTHYWALQCIDMVGNASLFAAAYALFVGARFHWKDHRLADIFLAAGILIILCFMGGYFIESSEKAWRVFVMAPSQVLACVAFIAIAIAAGERFKDFRLPIYIGGGAYALLQVPAYYSVFIEHLGSPEDISPAGTTLKLFLACGKAFFTVLSISIVGCIVGKKTSQVALSAVRITLTVVSIALTLSMIYLRVKAVP